jgi:hypothetical protein
MGGSVIGTLRDKAVNARKEPETGPDNPSSDPTLAVNNGEPLLSTAQ